MYVVNVMQHSASSLRIVGTARCAQYMCILVCVLNSESLGSESLQSWPVLLQLMSASADMGAGVCLDRGGQAHQAGCQDPHSAPHQQPEPAAHLLLRHHDEDVVLELPGV